MISADNGRSGVPILSWFDKPIKHAIWSVFNDVNKATEALDIFRRYRRNHFDRLKKYVSHIKILGMSQPVPLTEIYSPAMVSTTIFSRLYEQEWLSVSSPAPTNPSRQRAVGPLTRADEFIEAHSRVAVLGPAGSGKTTLLRHVALAMCDKNVFAETRLQTSRCPFFVALPSYARQTGGQQPLVDYLADELKKYTDDYAPEFVRRLLNKGLAILLLDSLDEVQSSLRDAVVEQIREVAAGFPHCPMVVSCRTADYDPISENFYEVELARLTEAAVRTIVEAWFRDERSKSEELLRHLRRDDSVRSLCETPLLLCLLCIQFRHDLALPQRKIELFRRCIDAFLRDWDASRGFRRDTAYSSLSDDRKERIFESVATAFLAEDVRYTFPTDGVVKCVEQCCDLFGVDPGHAEGILKEIEAHHGILEKFSADSYMFSHPSFLEYFAARSLLSQRRELEVVRRNFANERWAGVIEFVAAMHADPAAVLDFLLERSRMESVQNFPTMARRTSTLLLLYKCLSSGVNIANWHREELYDHIVSAHGHMSTIFRNGGVFPIAVLERDGLRHTYLYYKKRRTLRAALRPLRRLGNEILAAPSETYAEKALARLRSIVDGGKTYARYAGMAEKLCLAIPIAGIRPGEVGEILEGLRKVEFFRGVGPLIDESLEVMRLRE